jgi:Flp pilus assembly protein TadG
MRRAKTSLRGRSGTAGIAALEFALVLPFLFALFAGIADFSFVYHDELQLTAALAAGAQYAFTQGQTESGSTLTSDVTSFINTVSTIPLSTLSATYNNGLSATSCYCVKGSPAVYTGPLTCGAACTDGSGSTAGRFITITGGFSYTAIFPLDQSFFSNPMSQTVTARVQ